MQTSDVGFDQILLTFLFQNLTVGAGGHHFLGNTPDFDKPLQNQRTSVNAPLHAEALTLKSFVGVASESEVAVACANSKSGFVHTIALMELFHPQHQIPL